MKKTSLKYNRSSIEVISYTPKYIFGLNGNNIIKRFINASQSFGF